MKKISTPIDPAHYKLGKYNALDIQRASMGMEAMVGYHEGCVLKYMLRWRKKNGIEDLRKAQVHMQWLIESVVSSMEAKNENS